MAAPRNSQTPQGVRADGSAQGHVPTTGADTPDDVLRLFVADVRDYAIFCLDPAGLVTTWNAGAQRLKGYATAEIVGRHFRTFYTPEDVAAAKPEHELEIAFRDGRLEDEGWRVRQDGTRFWANVVITALRDPDGTLRGYGKITRDLTERRNSEEAMRASEERFRRAFQDAPIGLAIGSTVDGVLGRYLDVNRAMCELTGHDREHLLAMNAMSLLGTGDAERERGAMTDLLSGQIELFQGDQRYLHSTGRMVDASVGISLMRTSDGAPREFITQIADVSVRKRHEGELMHLVQHDQLTGLFNRGYLDDALNAHVARVGRSGPAGALLMIDLDHFKQVNDTLGHITGDRLIVAVARILEARIRDTDLLARLGGDEFAVLMAEGDAVAAQTLAVDISDLVRHRSATLEAGIPAGVSASIGIAVFDDRENLRAETILAEADEAMYTAKKQGRSRIASRFTETGMRRRHVARLAVHDLIDVALREGRFELHLQPIVDLGSGSITSYEALVRMIDEAGAKLPPARFIYVAERFDQIQSIDDWVIEHAIALLPELPPNRSLAINVSGRSLGDVTLGPRVSDVIAKARVDPSRVIFEITETAAIENMHGARHFAKQLTALGCRFALDNFGAGFGSFYYLRHLPFDYIKIDGEFIKKSAVNPTDQLIVRSCVQLARGLNKRTIAEFVEDEETLRLVEALGVDQAQGNAIGRPVAINAMPGFAGKS